MIILLLFSNLLMARDIFSPQINVVCLDLSAIQQSLKQWQLRGLVADAITRFAIFHHQDWHTFLVGDFLSETHWQVEKITPHDVTMVYLPSFYCPFYQYKTVLRL